MECAHTYFKANLEMRDGVMRAYHAYHANGEAGAHAFAGAGQTALCSRCSRTREQVRHGELPPECRGGVGPDIAGTIRREEESAWLLIARAEVDVRRVVARRGMSGETLATLHHTFGHDPEIVASVVPVPAPVLAAYHLEMEKERARSRAAQKRTIIQIAQNA